MKVSWSDRGVRPRPTFSPRSVQRVTRPISTEGGVWYGRPRANISEVCLRETRTKCLSCFSRGSPRAARARFIKRASARSESRISRHDALPTVLVTFGASPPGNGRGNGNGSDLRPRVLNARRPLSDRGAADGMRPLAVAGRRISVDPSDLASGGSRLDHLTRNVSSNSRAKSRAFSSEGSKVRWSSATRFTCSAPVHDLPMHRSKPIAAIVAGPRVPSMRKPSTVMTRPGDAQTARARLVPAFSALTGDVLAAQASKTAMATPDLSLVCTDGCYPAIP